MFRRVSTALALIETARALEEGQTGMFYYRFPKEAIRTKVKMRKSTQPGYNGPDILYIVVGEDAKEFHALVEGGEVNKYQRTLDDDGASGCFHRKTSGTWCFLNTQITDAVREKDGHIMTGSLSGYISQPWGIFIPDEKKKPNNANNPVYT